MSSPDPAEATHTPRPEVALLLAGLPAALSFFTSVPPQPEAVAPNSGNYCTGLPSGSYRNVSADLCLICVLQACLFTCLQIGLWWQSTHSKETQHGLGRKGPLAPSGPTPCSSRNTQSQVPGTTCRWLLKISKEEIPQALWAACASALWSAQCRSASCCLEVTSEWNHNLQVHLTRTCAQCCYLNPCTRSKSSWHSTGSSEEDKPQHNSDLCFVLYASASNSNQTYFYFILHLNNAVLIKLTSQALSLGNVLSLSISTEFHLLGFFFLPLWSLCVLKPIHISLDIFHLYHTHNFVASARDEVILASYLKCLLLTKILLSSSPSSVSTPLQLMEVNCVWQTTIHCIHQTNEVSFLENLLPEKYNFVHSAFKRSNDVCLNLGKSLIPRENYKLLFKENEHLSISWHFRSLWAKEQCSYFQRH